MNYEQARELLAQVNGCTFASIDTETVPALRGGKLNAMKDKVTKLCLGHRIMLFTNKQSNGYLNKVRRHLEREGKNPDSFQLSALQWGERVPDSPFIAHKGEHYLQAIFLASGSVQYVARETIDLPFKRIAKGCIIPKHDVIGLPETTGSEGQGLDSPVIVRTYKLSSIIALRAFHEELTD